MQVERCWLKPGLIATYRSDIGGTLVRTFLGYPGKSEHNCDKLLPPCQEWLEENTSVGKWVFFLDGDLNPLTRFQDPANGRTFYIFMKRFRWPLTIPDAWETEAIGADEARIRRDVKVMRWENVQTPAGYFWAICIEMHNTNMSPELKLDWKETNQTFCYDPALGITVKTSADASSVRHWELISLTWYKPK